MKNTDLTFPDSLLRVRSLALPAGVVALVGGGALALLFGGTDLFFQAYLYAFILCLAIPLGSLALLCVHHMTAGSWSFIIQRPLEAATRTIKYMAVLFLPVLLGPFFGLNNLYQGWVEPSGSHAVEAKAAYLNPEFWTGRAIFYFAVWVLLASLFSRWSKQLDDTDNPLITLKLRRLAPPALIIYCLTITFAVTDWVMSLEPEWFSTIYGPLFWMSQVLTTFAFMILILSALSDTKPISRYLTVDHYYQLGTFMLAFTVLWAYMSFSQYLIIWSGNLSEEIGYYIISRMDGGMSLIAVSLMLGHFLLPLLYLLQRRFKFNISRLTFAAYWMLSWRLVDVFYMINPAFHHEDPGFYLSEALVYVLVTLGLGGIWVWLFLGQLKRRPLLVLNDPRLANALSHGGEEELAEHA